MTATLIRDLVDHIGEEVRIRGWLFNKRSKGKIHFLQVRDGSGTVQAVAFIHDVDEETFATCGALAQECSLELTGEVRADDRAPGGVEIGVKTVRKVGDSPDYPISKKEHGVEFLMEHRHLWFRSRKQHALLRIRAEVIAAAQEILNDWGFVRFDTPILTPCSAEGTTDLFSTKYFDLGEAYLAQTGQLYVEAGMMAHGRVYCFSPTFRAEKSKTRRHLIEFWMLEPEVAWLDLDAVGKRVVLEPLDRRWKFVLAMRAPVSEEAVQTGRSVIRDLNAVALERLSRDRRSGKSNCGVRFGERRKRCSQRLCECCFTISVAVVAAAASGSDDHQADADGEDQRDHPHHWRSRRGLGC